MAAVKQSLELELEQLTEEFESMEMAWMTNKSKAALNRMDDIADRIREIEEILGVDPTF